MSEYDSDHPEVIRAKAEAKEKILQARAEMHPYAQVVYAVFDSLTNLIEKIGCLLIFLIVVVALFAPEVISALFGG